MFYAIQEFLKNNFLDQKHILDLSNLYWEIVSVSPAVQLPSATPKFKFGFGLFLTFPRPLFAWDF